MVEFSVCVSIALPSSNYFLFCSVIYRIKCCNSWIDYYAWSSNCVTIALSLIFIAENLVTKFLLLLDPLTRILGVDFYEKVAISCINVILCMCLWGSFGYDFNCHLVEYDLSSMIWVVMKLSSGMKDIPFYMTFSLANGCDNSCMRHDLEGLV